MPSPLEGKNIVLGVTGSIACHKAVDLASKMTQQGADVDVVMTEAALNFVTPLAFRSITHRPVVTDLFDPTSEASIDHVALAQRADIVVVAPATANTIAKIAGGLADDALTTTILATQAPVLLCPAMDAHMYRNLATQENVRTLKERGYTLAGPAEGHLASGLIGEGRLIEVPEILGHVRLVLGRKGDLAGRKIVVSAGGTREDVDPVRFLSNRSSGKMGYAVAEAARDRGASTVIVAAPNALPNPAAVRVVPVVSAEEMNTAVAAEADGADALIMAAAVADWRPKTFAHQKVKKGGSETWSIELLKTPDVVAGVNGDGLVKVGFAAESEDLLKNATAKLGPKGLDLIVANDVSDPESGFGTDTNRVVLLDCNGHTEELPLLTKYEVGHRILDRVAAMLAGRVKTRRSS